ncbi:ABC transporter ATP-binding protein [Fervidibacillus halotolerans]|uniref:Phosphate ABC transporter ATP-binding protein n=1 Tax=Fervidibacillus halotolerans TaxID=2980027 RepID=A0A9E8M0S3_9BACI|nr:phosphate ABC transporter ATP-binding protein [Fervidibacillus halotolerans]WAA12476.1 phosphate ABC transporter ATP-binding protein [Fervidibacillus halotolerans]
MSNNEQTAIRFEHVSYSINGKNILYDITGNVPIGKITTIVGPSGTGKSTLFRLSNGLISPDSGKIFVLGKNIEEYDPVSLRKIVALAPQSAPMIEGTVFSNLRLPFDLHGKAFDETEAKKLLHLVNLDPDLLFHDANRLSGGERQKVSIARTLANRPQILLLDEITSSLDPVSQQEIEHLILSINEKYKTTILWITHQMDQAIRVGDFTWMLMDGKLAESGKISELQMSDNVRIQQFIKGETK